MIELQNFIKMATLFTLITIGSNAHADESKNANEAVNICISSNTSKTQHDALSAAGWLEVTAEKLDSVVQNLVVVYVNDFVQAQPKETLEDEPITPSAYQQIVDGMKVSYRKKLENKSYIGLFVKETHNVVVSLSAPLDERINDNVGGAHICVVQMFNAAAYSDLDADPDMKKAAGRRGFPAGFSLHGYKLRDGSKASVSGSAITPKYWKKVYTKANTKIPYRERTILVFPQLI